MTERAEKQRRKKEHREQETVLRQKQQRRKQLCLRIFFHLFMLAGAVCFLAMVITQAFSLLLGTLWLWTAGAWCNWGLDRDGFSLFLWGQKFQYGQYYAEHYGNLTLALVLSAAALALTLFFAAPFLRRLF